MLKKVFSILVVVSLVGLVIGTGCSKAEDDAAAPADTAAKPDAGATDEETK